jgi:hypothetical protein
MLFHRLGRFMLAGVLVILPRGAQAQSDTDAKAAAQLFQQGRDSMKRGEYAIACEKFGESQRLAQAPGTLLNLAACSEKLGRIQSAAKALRAARQLLVPGDSRIGYIDAQIAAIEPRVPRVTIRLPEALEDGLVSVDGDPVSHTRLRDPIALDPGRHEIALTIADHEDSSVVINLVEGATETVQLNPGPATTPALAPIPREQPNERPALVAIEPKQETHSSGSGRRTAAYIAFGVGGAGLVVGTVTGLLVLSKKSTMEANCDDDFACNSAGLDAASAGQTFSTISTLSFIAAAAGAGVGAYLLLSSDSDTALGVVPSARGAALEMRHRF